MLEGQIDSIAKCNSTRSRTVPRCSAIRMDQHASGKHMVDGSIAEIG